VVCGGNGGASVNNLRDVFQATRLVARAITRLWATCEPSKPLLKNIILESRLLSGDA
jgi:hypothetical protein